MYLRWLPIMKAYEGGNPAYFATPPVNLIYAYNASLSLITAKRAASEGNLPPEVVVPLEKRFDLHKAASAKVRKAVAELGLKTVPLAEDEAANGMTAVSLPVVQPHSINLMATQQIYYPEGLGAADIIPRLSQRGVVVAGGLHTEIKGKDDFLSKTLRVTDCVPTSSDKYFRIGHMGLSVVDTERADVDRVVASLKEVVAEAKAQKSS